MNSFEQQNISLDGPFPVSMVSAERKAAFLKKIYLHVAGAFLAFALLETVLFTSGLVTTLFSWMASSQMVLFGIMIGFMFAAGAVERWAHNATDKSTQYLALLVYIMMYAVFFVPMISVAFRYSGANALTEILLPAGFVSIGLFVGLVATALFSGKDFSFLKSILAIAFPVALGVIVISVLFGMSLGAWFSVAMIVLMGGAILFQTSRILNNYHEEQYVMASVSVFASFMTLLFYVLRLFMSRD